MKCKICKKQVDLDDLWADTYCQDCWEEYCDNEWWDMIKTLPAFVKNKKEFLNESKRIN